MTSSPVSETPSSISHRKHAARRHRVPGRGAIRMQNYITRFAAMVEHLKNCPEAVALLNYNVFEPAADAKVARVEATLGFPLGEGVRSFYRQTNGLQLRWILR